MTQTIQLKHCRFEFDHDSSYCQTVFDDGAVVPAIPEDNDEYRQRAVNLGYGSNVMQMCFDHELLHTMIAEMRGEPFSRVLRHVADGGSDLTEIEIGEEEERVLELQKRLCRVEQTNNPLLHKDLFTAVLSHWRVEAAC